MGSIPRTTDTASESEGAAQNEADVATVPARRRRFLEVYQNEALRAGRRIAPYLADHRQQRSKRSSQTLWGGRTFTPSAPADDSDTAPVVDRVGDYIGTQSVAAARLLPPTAAVLVALVLMTGLAAAQEGGVCGTPAVDLFEWAAQTGAGILFLGGLLYGGFEHARAGLSRNPEMTRQHRAKGTMAMIAGPIFGLVIIFGEQAAAAAGFSVAECANVTPW